MPFDPATLAFNLGVGAYDVTIGGAKTKRAKKRAISNALTTEAHAINREVGSFLADSSFRTLAGGGREGSLAPAVHDLAGKQLRDLIKKRQREIEEL